MKKIVPDPPLPSTSHHLFGHCDAGHKALDHLDATGKSLLWANLHSVEMAEGLAEAMLEGIECGSNP